MFKNREWFDHIFSCSVYPAWLEFRTQSKQTITMLCILAIPLLLGLVQYSVSRTTSENINRVYDRPQDRIAIYTRGLNGEHMVTKSEAVMIDDDLSKKVNALRVGWSRDLGATYDHKLADSKIQIKEANINYLEILIKQDETSKCQLCLFKEGNYFLVGPNTDSDLFQPGDSHLLLDKQTRFGGKFNEAWRDVELSSSIVVSTHSIISRLSDSPATARWVVEFEHVPTEKEILAIRTIINPNNPVSVLVESALTENETASHIRSLLGSSSQLFRYITLFIYVGIGVISQLLTMRKKRIEVALFRTLGASVKDLILKGLAEGLLLGLGSWLICFSFINLFQGYAIAFLPHMFSPVKLFEYLLSLFVSVALCCVFVAFAILLSVNRDPADVIRSTGE